MILNIKDTEFELKFSIMLDKALNKHVKDEDVDTKGRNKVSGGIAKVLPELIDQDVDMLATVIDVANKLKPKDKQFKGNFDDILEAIDDRMNEDEDATKIFSEVFEAIDSSAFSRNELKKFADNMLLVKEMRSDELDENKANLMIKRLNSSYQAITGNILVEVETA